MTCDTCGKVTPHIDRGGVDIYAADLEAVFCSWVCLQDFVSIQRGKEIQTERLKRANDHRARTEDDDPSDHEHEWTRHGVCGTCNAPHTVRQ